MISLYRYTILLSKSIDSFLTIVFNVEMNLVFSQLISLFPCLQRLTRCSCNGDVMFSFSVLRFDVFFLDNHSLFVHRMLGDKMGTGGTGYRYLHETVRSPIYKCLFFVFY